MADAASDDIQNRGGKIEEIQWEREMVENSWVEQEDKRCCQEGGRGTSRSEMRKTPKTVRCTLLSGSARCTERNCEKVHRYL